jgi:succinylarginine dihydrolase
MTRAHEINFDGLVGPTHNYAGLSIGNVASMSHKSATSNPKQAALQGLAKMKFLHDLGRKQAVLPPHERPHIPTLRSKGYTGTDAQILAKVAKENPLLLAQVSSGSAMWTANAATVSPSADTHDDRVHFTPANLISNLHRSIEAQATARILRAIFQHKKHFAHHDPLPTKPQFADEGAANHMRLTPSDHGDPGIEIFVYGRLAKGALAETRFPRRQTFESADTIARQHLINTPFFLIQQSADAIDAGAFHNDVVAVANRNVLLHHERAWETTSEFLAQLKEKLPNLIPATATEKEIPLEDAVSSYLFNSQLVTLPDQSTALIAPLESQENPRTRAFIQKLKETKIIAQTHFVDLKQSMQNGGGPACLRLRVVLTDEQLKAMHQGVLFTNELHARLKTWIERHYRDELHPEDLADPHLLEESRAALQELAQILGLPL